MKRLVISIADEQGDVVEVLEYALATEPDQVDLVNLLKPSHRMSIGADVIEVLNRIARGMVQ